VTLISNDRTLRVADICAEPFRVFFPLGLALGVVGVALWPAYYGGRLNFYPAASHARLMIEGFMASFIVGFLGTAGPRITSTAAFSRVEIFTLLTLDLLAAGLHCGGSNRAGDTVFVLFLLVFAVALGKRFARRQDWPPPNFVLVALGLLNGIIGSALVARYGDAVYSQPYRLGAALLEQAFVLLPILGVAPFLLPRLLDVPRSDDLPEGRALPPRWIVRALFAVFIGLVIDASLFIETGGATAVGAWLRVIAISAYLALRIPKRGRSFLGDSLRVGIATVVLAFVVEALWPHLGVAALHIVFITGFGFIVMTVAVRVVYGHSGNAHLFTKRLPFFVSVAVLMFLAMISRYVADVAPQARAIHLVAAASCWLAGAVIWAVKVLPKVATPDPVD
jgi:uncharacterized protein involved in response to NO